MTATPVTTILHVDMDAFFASVGIAGNKFLAKIASDMNKPDGITVVPRDGEEIKAFLAPRPIGRLWGVGKVTEAAFRAAGFDTIGSVQRAPRDVLVTLVGQDRAEHFRQLVNGEDSRRVEGDVEAKSISREHTFGEDVSDPRVLRDTLLELIEDVGRQLRESEKYARVVAIKVRWQGFDTITRRTTLPIAVCDDITLRAAALKLFDGVKLIKPVRLVGYGVSSLAETQGEQLSLFATTGGQIHKRERLSRATDSIGKRFGKASSRLKFSHESNSKAAENCVYEQMVRDRRGKNEGDDEAGLPRR